MFATCAFFLFFIISLSAHVEVIPSTGVATESIMFSFRVPHSCSATDITTTNITVVMPMEILSARPHPSNGWNVTVKPRLLDPPVLSGTKLVNSSVESVSWSGGALPTTFAEEFKLLVGLPNITVGTTLYFKIYQVCSASIVAWDQIPTSAGQSVSKPAGKVTIVAAESANLASTVNLTSSVEFQRMQTLAIASIVLACVGFLMAGVSVLKLCTMAK